MKGSEILQKNAAFAARLRSRADAVDIGQLEELSNIIASLDKKVSPTEAAKAYLDAFYDVQLISEGFAVFLHLLWKKELLQTTAIAAGIQESNEPCSLFYVPNSYSELAKKKFSGIIPAAVPRPQTDFQTICETVASEENSFCILPISSSAEGELPAFARMIHEYQFKIRAVCDVTTSDGETELRLALLSGQIYWTQNSQFIQITFLPESSEQLFSLFSAIQRLGGNLYSINARPMEYNMNRFLYKITVNSSPEYMCSIAAFVRAALHTSVSGVFNIL